jgi:cell division initiation protein
MRTTPLNIKRMEFNKSFRGYNVEEVQSFLDKLADEFEEVQKENDIFKKQLEDASAQLSEFKRIEKNLQDTLLKAQENSAKAIDSTKKQVNLMIKEAEIKASQMIEKAREQADEIRGSIIKLREERDLIIAKLKAIVNTQSNILEMKVEKISEETNVEKKLELPKNIEIDINQIVERLV